MRWLKKQLEKIVFRQSRWATRDDLDGGRTNERKLAHVAIN